MQVALVAGLLFLALTGCSASDEEVTAQVRAVEKRLTQQLAESEQELERLRRTLRTSETRAKTAEDRVVGADAQAKVGAEQALAGQTSAVKALEASLKEKEAALVVREQAVGTAEAEAAANTVEGDGTYVVGDDLEPGTYKSAGGDNCYWARLEQGGAELVDNNIGAGPALVTVRSSDFALEVSRCAPLRRTD